MAGILFHCYCTGVTQQRVLRTMAGRKLGSVEEIRAATGACSGCQTCRRELEDLIAAVDDGRIRLPAAG